MVDNDAFFAEYMATRVLELELRVARGLEVPLGGGDRGTGPGPAGMGVDFGAQCDVTFCCVPLTGQGWASERQNRS